MTYSEKWAENVKSQWEEYYGELYILGFRGMRSCRETGEVFLQYSKGYDKVPAQERAIQLFQALAHGGVRFEEYPRLPEIPKEQNW
jgi:hypothetical protein